MSNNNTLTIGIIILAIVGVVAYSLSKNGVNPNPSVSPTVSASPTASPSPTITPTPTPQTSTTPTPSVDVSDWKIYKNEEYGFGLKYPSEFLFKIIKGHVGPGVPGGDYNQTAVAIHFTIPTVDPAYINDPSKNQMPIFTILVYTKKQWEEFGNNEYQDSLSLNKNKELFLGENKGLVYISDNHIYESRVPADFVPKSSMVNNILKTFSFIGKDETVNWKTYSNDKYGFEFKYPNNFDIKEHVFGSTGQDWDGSKINKLAIFDLFDNNESGPIVNPALRFSITTVSYSDVLKRYKEMEKISIGDNYQEKQLGIEIGGIKGVELNSYAIFPVKNYTFVFDKTFKNIGSVFNQILATFKFTTE